MLLDPTNADAPADPCATCPHKWHGLPCQGVIYPHPGRPYSAEQCTCLGPFNECLCSPVSGYHPDCPNHGMDREYVEEGA